MTFSLSSKNMTGESKNRERERSPFTEVSSGGCCLPFMFPSLFMFLPKSYREICTLFLHSFLSVEWEWDVRQLLTFKRDSVTWFSSSFTVYLFYISLAKTIFASLSRTSHSFGDSRARLLLFALIFIFFSSSLLHLKRKRCLTVWLPKPFSVCLVFLFFVVIFSWLVSVDVMTLCCWFVSQTEAENDNKNAFPFKCFRELHIFCWISWLQSCYVMFGLTWRLLRSWWWPLHDFPFLSKLSTGWSDEVFVYKLPFFKAAVVFCHINFSHLTKFFAEDEEWSFLTSFFLYCIP